MTAAGSPASIPPPGGGFGGCPVSREPNPGGADAQQPRDHDERQTYLGTDAETQSGEVHGCQRDDRPRGKRGAAVRPDAGDRGEIVAEAEREQRHRPRVDHGEARPREQEPRLGAVRFAQEEVVAALIGERRRELGEAQGARERHHAAEDPEQQQRNVGRQVYRGCERRRLEDARADDHADAHGERVPHREPAMRVASFRGRRRPRADTHHGVVRVEPSFSQAAAAGFAAFAARRRVTSARAAATSVSNSGVPCSAATIVVAVRRPPSMSLT